MNRFLNVQSAYSPTFSPDGERVAFVMNTTGVPQVYSVGRQGGWPEQLTFYDERVGALKYSPVADRLVFGMDAGGNERQQLFCLRGDGSRVVQLTDHPEAIHNLGDWSHDGRQIAFAANRQHPAHFHIYVQPVDSIEARLVLAEDGSHTVAGFSPDDRYLLIIRANTNFDHDVLLLDLETLEVQTITPHAEEAVYSHLAWTPDGAGLYLVTNAGRDLRRIAYYRLADGTLEEVCDAEWEVEGLALSPEADRLAYLVNVDGYSELNVLQLDTGTSTSIEGLPPGVYGDLAWAPDAGHLALRVDGSRNNSNVWLCDPERGAVRQLTFASRAGIPREVLVEPELIHYETFDGLSIPAFYYRPLSAGDEKLPVVVDIHGGPEGQRRVNFNPVTQYLVNHGFCVFAPNVRGSAGYGRKYLAMDDVEKRMDTVRDIRWGVDWLVDEGGADPDRLAVMGGSYGGFMVLACITEYPDLWAGAIDVVGIANFITFLENTGPWRRHLREAEYGSLKDDYDFLVSISPIHKAHRIRAPLLVIHGDNDPRVPVGEAEQIVGEVREGGGTVEYLVFDDEGHGIIKLANRIRAYRTAAEFLDRYVRGG